MLLFVCSWAGGGGERRNWRANEETNVKTEDNNPCTDVCMYVVQQYAKTLRDLLRKIRLELFCFVTLIVA